MKKRLATTESPRHRGALRRFGGPACIAGRPTRPDRTRRRTPGLAFGLVSRFESGRGAPPRGARRNAERAAPPRLLPYVILRASRPPAVHVCTPPQPQRVTPA